MTISIPLITLPDTGSGQDMTGRPPAPALRLALSRPAVLALVSPPGHGSRPAAPGRPKDRSGLWLRNAAAGLGVLAAAAAAVSFTAQFRMVDATRHLAVIAALEAAIPDAAALVFASLGIALALHGRRALRARALEPGRGRRQRGHERPGRPARLAEPSYLGHAAGRLRAGQRHPDRRRPRLGARTPPAAGHAPGR